MNKVSLSTLASVSAGQSAPKQNEFADEGIPFVRAGSLEALLSGKKESDLELVPENTARKLKLRLYPRGAVVFAKSGMSATKDRIYVLRNPAYVVSHLSILIPNEKVHGEYLRLALKKFPPSSLIKDPAYPAIGLGEIEGFKIPIPEDFDDQIRIAHLLCKVEGLIAQRKQHLQQLDDLLKSVFLEMFGDPVRNEKGWPTDDLDSFIDQERGISYGIVQRGDHFPGGVPVLRIRDIIGEDYLEPDLVRTDPSNSGKYARTILQGGELLLSIRGTVGAISVAPLHSKGWNVSRELAVIPVAQGVNTNYLVHLLKSPSMQRQFSSLIKGVAQSGLNLADIRRIKIVLPPSEMQSSFEHLAARIEGLIRTYRNSLTDIEALYGGLNQQAFKGELDLSRVLMQPTAGDLEIKGSAPFIRVDTVKDLQQAVNLPDVENMAEALTTIEGRRRILYHWLEAYAKQLKGSTLSVNDFLTIAKARMAELDSDNHLEIGLSEYEQLKDWVFAALDDGRLHQSRNIIGRDEKDSPIWGNRVTLHSRAQS